MEEINNELDLNDKKKYMVLKLDKIKKILNLV
jgi:hypothetical protein